MRKLPLSPEISKFFAHGRVEKSLLHQPFYLRRFKSKSKSQNNKILLLATCLVNTWQLLFEKISLMKRDCQIKIDEKTRCDGIQESEIQVFESQQ